MMGRKTAQTNLSYGLTLDRLVPQDHFVRSLDSAFDFTVVRKLSARHFSHLGQPSVDPVVLVKLIVLGYWEGIRSERHMLRMAEVNVAWRWFLNYDFEEPLFHPTVLTNFRKRVGDAFFRELLHEVVGTCRKKGLIRGTAIYVDSTLTDADASKEVESRALLEQLTSVEEYVEALHVVNDGEEDEEPVGPESPREKRPRGQGLPSTGAKRKSEGYANRMMASRTDMDAELFRKEGEPVRLCHKTHLSVDNGPAKIITAVHVTNATEHDSHAVEAILDEHERNVGCAPDAFVADKGYSTKATYRHLEGRSITAVIPPKRYANSTHGRRREEFTFELTRNAYICPQGHELKDFSISTQDSYTIYKPAPRTCQGCKLKQQCAPGKGDRSIARHWDQGLVERAEEFMGTSHGKRLYRRRMHVCEAPNGELKTQGLLGRAKYRGRWKMAIQSYGEVITYDLKRLARAGSYLANEGVVENAVLTSLSSVFELFYATLRHSTQQFGPTAAPI